MTKQEALKFAVKEINSYAKYPIEYRIGKMLIKAGFSSLSENVHLYLSEVDPTLGQFYTNKVFNAMRDIELTKSKSNQFYIDNVPDL